MAKPTWWNLKQVYTSPDGRGTFTAETRCWGKPNLWRCYAANKQWVESKGYTLEKTEITEA